MIPAKNFSKSGLVIHFDEVRNIYRAKGRFTHPLLDPVDKIELILREYGALFPYEHLGDFDEDRELFPIVIFADVDSKLGFWKELKYKVAKFIASL